MIEIKVTANIKGGNCVLTATDKVNTEQEAYYSIVGFATWFAGAYAKDDLSTINQCLRGMAVRTEQQAMIVLKYKSKDIKLQATSKRIS